MLIGTPPSSASMSIYAPCSLVRSQARSSHVPLLGLAGDEGTEALGHLGLFDPLEPGCGDGGDGRVDAAGDVGPARGGILLGRLVEALHRELDGRGAVHALVPPELDRRAGVAAARAGGVEVGLLVAA